MAEDIDRLGKIVQLTHQSFHKGEKDKSLQNAASSAGNGGYVIVEFLELAARYLREYNYDNGLVSFFFTF